MSPLPANLAPASLPAPRAVMRESEIQSIRFGMPLSEDEFKAMRQRQGLPASATVVRPRADDRRQ